MMCCYWPMTYLKNDPKLRQNRTCVESGDRFDKEATSHVSGDRPERNEEGGCNHMTQYYYYYGDDSTREHARPAPYRAGQKCKMTYMKFEWNHMTLTPAHAAAIGHAKKKSRTSQMIAKIGLRAIF